MNNGLFTSNTDEWETPQELFQKLDAEFHFNLDPCAMDAATERMKSSQQKPGSMHSVTLGDAVQMFPTPSASIALGSTGGSRRCDLRNEVAKAEGGRLNPDWVEWLMGVPIGWTSLTECHEQPPA